MRAAVYRRAGEVEIEAVSVPVPDVGEALIEIDFCGICGTDLHMMLDGWGRPVRCSVTNGRVVSSMPLTPAWSQEPEWSAFRRQVAEIASRAAPLAQVSANDDKMQALRSSEARSRSTCWPIPVGL